MNDADTPATIQSPKNTQKPTIASIMIKPQSEELEHFAPSQGQCLTLEECQTVKGVEAVVILVARTYDLPWS